MNRKQKLFAGFLVLFLIVFISVGCIQNAIVPMEIDQDAIAYTGEEPTMYLPWTTIHDGNRIQRKMEYIHLTKQETAKRLSEDDSMFYDYINDNMTINFTNAQQIKDAVFDPTGPVGLLITGGIFGTLGLMVDKPGTRKRLDVAKEEGKKEANGDKGLTT